MEQESQQRSTGETAQLWILWMIGIPMVLCIVGAIIAGIAGVP